MEDKYYAVIDTNVIVSALISKKAESYPLSVMAHVYSGVIIPVFNNEIINEYKDVLSREKFHLNQSPGNPSGLPGPCYTYKSRFCEYPSKFDFLM